MGRISLSKFTSIVSIVFVSLVGSVAVAQQGSAPPNQPSGYGYPTPRDQFDDTNARSDKQACDKAISDVETARGEAIGACKDAKGKVTENGKTSKSKFLNCSIAVESCEDDAESIDGLVGVAGTVLGAFGLNGQINGGLSNSCEAFGDMTQSDFKSEKRDVERDKRDAERKKLDAEEKKIRGEEDYQKEVNEIQKGTRELLEDIRKEKSERESNDRADVAGEKKTLDEITRSISSLERNILTIQNAQKVLPEEQKAKNFDYEAELLDCQLKVQAAQQDPSKFPAQMRRSLGGQGKTQASRKSMLDRMWNACAGKVLAKRKTDISKYEANVADLEMQYKTAVIDLKSAKESLELFKKQQLEAAQSKEKDKAAKAVNDLATYNEYIRQQKQIDQLMGQKRYLNMMDINQSTSELNLATNSLKRYNRENTPGRKQRSEAVPIIVKYSSAALTCQQVCPISRQSTCNVTVDVKEESKAFSGGAN
jgi:hypothetical protein